MWNSSTAAIDRVRLGGRKCRQAGQYRVFKRTLRVATYDVLFDCLRIAVDSGHDSRRCHLTLTKVSSESPPTDLERLVDRGAIVPAG
jgi:hypothetical protein